MFTGIIEQTGLIHSVERSGTNLLCWIKSGLFPELKVDQSLSHNGVCLTVDQLQDGLHRVTAVQETLEKTNLGNWQPGTIVNLERCMPLNGRLDGHIVQGHVDTTAVCTGIAAKDGSWEFNFQFDTQFAAFIIEKGSISLNGISLTIFNISEDGFTVAIIPYTYMHTNMQQLKAGDSVNIEFDVIGKYVNRITQLQKN